MSVAMSVDQPTCTIKNFARATFNGMWTRFAIYTAQSQAMVESAEWVSATHMLSMVLLKFLS